MIDQRSFYDICFDLLLKSLNIPEIVPVVRDIKTGQDYINNFPWETNDFLLKRNEIIFYIRKARLNNVIDLFKEKKGSLALSQISNGKPLDYANQNDLFETLKIEIPRLILKGMYYLIKNHYPNLTDEQIIPDLFLSEISVLNKYSLL